MVKLIINGKPFKGANNYIELTIGQFQSIYSWELDKPVEERDHYKLFCLLHPIYKGIEHTPVNETAVWELTRFVIEQPIPYLKNIPEVIKLDGKTLRIPKNIGHISIGQNIVLGQMLDKGKYIEEHMTFALAVYLQPIFDETVFNLERARELEKLIKTMPAQEVYGLGFFILMNVNKNGRRPLNRWQLIKINLRRKSSQMLQLWPKLAAYPSMVICLWLLTTLKCSDWIQTKFSTRQALTVLSISSAMIKKPVNTKNDLQRYGK